MQGHGESQSDDISILEGTVQLGKGAGAEVACDGLSVDGYFRAGTPGRDAETEGNGRLFIRFEFELNGVREGVVRFFMNSDRPSALAERAGDRGGTIQDGGENTVGIGHPHAGVLSLHKAAKSTTNKV